MCIFGQHRASDIGRDLTLEDLNELYPGYSDEALLTAIERHRRGLPDGRAFVPSLIVKYVPRSGQRDIVREVLATERDGQARSCGIILYGVAGIGKTTLATAIAHDDDVGGAFYDGVFWVDTCKGSPDAWTESLCAALGRERALGERWPGCWQQWTGDAGRRCLLVVDDLADEAHLEPLIAGLRAQTVVLATTQQPEAAYMAMEKWLPAGRIERFGLGG